METQPRLLTRNFILLWQGQTVSLLGSNAYMIAMMLWVKQVTGSSSLVGFILMIGGLAMFLSPVGGTVADRYSRVKLIVVLDTINGLAILFLTALFFLFPDNIQLLIMCLFCVNILREICTAFFSPAVFALIPDIVEEQKLNSANSWFQSMYHIIDFIAHGLGGILFRILGAPVLFLADGISFLVSAFSESFIRTEQRLPPKDHPDQKPMHAFFSETREGFSYIWSNKGPRTFMLLACVYNFVQSSFLVLLPFYVEDILGARVDWFGYILAGFGLGNFLGIILAGFSNLKGMKKCMVMIVCLVGVGIARGLMGFTTNAYLALCCLTTAGFLTGYYGVFISSVIQKYPPPEIRGRVIGSLTALRFGVRPLGLGFFGMLSDVLGGQIPAIFWGCGIIMIVSTLYASTVKEYREFFAS